MAVPRLTACCCCSLYVGVIIIGVVLALLDVIGMFIMGHALSHRQQLVVVENTTELDENQELDPAVQRDVDTSTWVAIVLIIVILAVSLLANISLLVAAKQKRPRWLLPWTVWNCLLTVIMLAWGIYVMVWLSANDKDATQAWVFAASWLVAAGVTVYLVAVVVGFYLELGEQRGGHSSYNMQPVSSG